MFVIAKQLKELFASTLNRIPVSVKCLSSMIGVLNAKFTRLLAAHANKKDGEHQRSPATVPCFASRNTLMLNFYRSLDLKTSLLYIYILFNDLCKLIEI